MLLSILGLIVQENTIKSHQRFLKKLKQNIRFELTFAPFWHIITTTEPRTPLYNAYHARSFYYKGQKTMLKSHQPPFGVDKQIENLKNLGLHIEDEEAARDFLNNVSYFRLVKAFGLGLKNADSTFKSGVTFEQIKGLYIFNSKLRHLLFSQIEKVEVNLRCRVANYFSCKYGVLGYKDASNFQNAEYHANFYRKLPRKLIETERLLLLKISKTVMKVRSFRFTH